MTERNTHTQEEWEIERENNIVREWCTEKEWDIKILRERERHAQRENEILRERERRTEREWDNEREGDIYFFYSRTVECPQPQDRELCDWSHYKYRYNHYKYCCSLIAIWILWHI